MPLSHDITLPVSHTPAWPAVCIHCGREHPDSVFRFRASRVGWDQLLTLGLALGSRPRIEAPACTICIPPLRRARLFRTLTSWLFTIPITLAVLFLLSRLGLLPRRPYRNYAAAGVILAALSPQILWEIIHPLTIDATAKGQSLDYEFRDPIYAQLFAELNGAEVE